VVILKAAWRTSFCESANLFWRSGSEPFARLVPGLDRALPDVQGLNLLVQILRVEGSGLVVNGDLDDALAWAGNKRHVVRTACAATGRRYVRSSHDLTVFVEQDF
jgi:hypothetical protein